MFRPPPWLRALLLAGLVVAIVAAALNREALQGEGLAGFVAAHPGAMPAVFVVLHVAASVAFVPRGLLAIAAGTLFGAWWGGALAVAGSMAGAMAGFWLARLVGGEQVSVAGLPGVGPFLARAERGGWRVVLVARLVPVLPHSLVNYACGLSRLGAGHFFLGSLLGMLPQTVAFVQLGAAGAQAASGGHFLPSLLWGAALLVGAALAPRLVARLRRR